MNLAEVQGAGLEAGTVGACAQCAIQLGVDPIWAPVFAAVAVFGARLVLGAAERWIASRTAKSRQFDT